MDVALEDRQAIEVRANPADQHVVTVVQQVVCSDGGADLGRSLLDELHGIGGSDVLEHHLEGREALDHSPHVFIDEDLLAIEDIDITMGHFAMDQQRQADFSHGFQDWEDLVDAGHARVRVGSGAGRVQLGGVHEATGLGFTDFVRLGAVGEVEHHQRFEAAAGWASSQDTLAVGIGLFGVAYRRYQVGHDDGAAKGARDICDCIGQHGPIAKMDVPVVGTQ